MLTQRLCSTLLVGLAIVFVLDRTGYCDNAPKPESPEWPRIVELYQKMGLPLPPPEAKLVRMLRSSTVDRRRVVHVRLGFVVSGRGGEERVLSGISVVSRTNSAWDAVEASNVDAKTLEVSSREALFPADDALATAIQCESVGMHSLANAIVGSVPSVFADGSEGSISRQFRASVVFGPPDLSLKSRVAYLAWAYWCNAIAEADCDRTVAAKRMEELLALDPALRGDDEKIQLFESLKSSLQPTSSKPGSVEALIDDLVNVSGDAGGGQRVVGDDKRRSALSLRGFEAVPTLLEHITDKRLTKAHIGSRSRMIVPRHLCVGELVSYIIANLAGTELPGGWSDRGYDFSRDRVEKARKWWDGAKKTGEKAYFRSHVLPVYEDGRTGFPLRVMYLIVAKRYPEELPEIFRRSVQAGVPSYRFSGLAVCMFDDLPGIVRSSGLSNDQKIELLIWGSTQPLVSSASIDELRRFDSKDVARIRGKLGGN